MGLDRMAEFARQAELLDAIGSPSGPQFIHITGTNGKGSVTAYVQSILCEAGYRVGGFFSPYVYDFRERIQLDCSPIPKRDLAALVQDLAPIADRFDDSPLDPITEFEFKTGLGLRYWKKQRCDWVALEVGLGGRLDATNIVTPQACVIASISLDHTVFLGDTTREIAGEKAGILKKGAPAIVGSVDSDALETICAHADSVGAGPIWLLGRELNAQWTGSGFNIRTPKRVLDKAKLGIKGVWQGANAAMAVAAVDAAISRHGGHGLPSDETVKVALSKTRLPGRFEVLQLSEGVVVLDGGHNRGAALSLAESLALEFPQRRCVLLCGMNQGHDPADFMAPLAPIVDEVHTVPLPFHRTYGATSLADAARSLGLRAHAHGSISRAIRSVLADLGDRVLVVAGSFYLLGPAKSCLPTRGTARQR